MSHNNDGKKPGDRDDIVDAHVERFTENSTSRPPATLEKSADAALAADARTDLVAVGEPTLYGSRAFFARAADELFASTKDSLELGGAAFARTHGGRVLLVGLKRERAGLPGKIAMDPSWGTFLWHTHPGLRGSVAAFSTEDLEVARVTGKPLLVIGFGGLSVDVLSTFTLPMGLRPFAVSAGLKALMHFERRGTLRRRLLALGVAARVCWPSGRIQPVLRAHATPVQAAIDDMSFAVDKGVGAVERAGQNFVKELLKKVQ